jgi:hypothetical protein
MRSTMMILCASLALALAACGGGDAAPPAAGGQRAGAALTDEQTACLKEQGVTLPQGGRAPGGGAPGGGTPGGGAPGGGAPGGGTPGGGAPGGRAPGGGTPGGGQRPELSAEQRAQFEAQRAKRTKAFTACGIEMPAGGRGGSAPRQ